MEYLRMDKDGHLRLARPSEIRHKDTDTVTPHHEWTPYAGPVVWTGPDGKSHHRLTTVRDWRPVGVGAGELCSDEKTLSSTYISRAPRDTPFPRSRVNFKGEIGWWYNSYRGVPVYRACPVNIDR